jgi:hypothetical protein
MPSQSLTIFVMCLLAIVLQSCSGKPEETLAEYANGAFKVAVRSQEFHHSSIHNIDVCVAETSTHKFPSDKAQCFLHGYDFSNLSVKWTSEHAIEISFMCGNVSFFQNTATVSPQGANREGFHAKLNDLCDRK